MSANQWAVACANLTKKYKGVTAVADLTLHIPHGAIFGFLGRNGAGKTTTIRMLTGLAHPTAGTAWINGHPITAAGSAARAQFGYLPQDPAFYPWMTPPTFLDYVGSLCGMDKAARRRRSEELLALVGLTDAAKRPIRGFSGGMTQRLGIAQALMHRPPVLFLDEPTSALDPAGRYELLSLIEDLRGQVTVFLSSHILADVERVCDTIGIIHKGKLLQVDARDDLLGQHAANIVQLRFPRTAVPPADQLLPEVIALPWVEEATQEARELRIAIRDADAAHAELLPFLAAQRVQVERLAWERPSLEDIFLQISQ